MQLYSSDTYISKKPRKIAGFLLLIGGNVWESNPPLGLTRDSGFEGRGAHQGHIRFQTYGTPDRIWTCDLLLRRQTLYPAELRAQDNQLPTGNQFNTLFRWFNGISQ